MAGCWLVVVALTVWPALCLVGARAARDGAPPPAECEDDPLGCLFRNDPADQAELEVLVVGFLAGVVMLSIGAAMVVSGRRRSALRASGARRIVVMIGAGVGMVLLWRAALWYGQTGQAIGGMLMVHGALLWWALSAATSPAAGRVGGPAHPATTSDPGTSTTSSRTVPGKGD